MKFSVGFGTRNALLNGSNKEAAYRQDPVEHEIAIHKYERPGQTPAERLFAIEKGQEEERELPKYWDDEYPRRDINESSSWIDEIEYLPSMGLAIMKTNGHEYYYPMTSKEVGDWVTSDSLGGYYNRNVKLRK